MRTRILLRITRSILAWAGCAFLVHQVTAASSIATERHVVVIVWDGMRPDFVTPENTPALWKLAKGGVFFRNHHAVFLSATNVNGVAIATGHYPSRNGIFANYVYRPDIDGAKCVDTAIPALVNKGDEISGGNYLAAPTIAELVRAAGRRVNSCGRPKALREDSGSRREAMETTRSPCFSRTDRGLWGCRVRKRPCGASLRYH